MKLERSQGGIEEYDMINGLVHETNVIIADRSMALMNETGWPPCRCREAAIIENLVRVMKWDVDDFTEARRRALVHARWRQSRQGISRAGVGGDRRF